MFKIFLVIFLVIIPETVFAKMQTFLRSPIFKPQQTVIITTPLIVSNGLTVLKVENIQTGCVFTVIRETGTIVSVNDKC